MIVGIHPCVSILKAGFYSQWSWSQSHNQKHTPLPSSENRALILLILLTTPFICDQVETGLSESQAEAEELNHSQSMGKCIAICLYFHFCFQLRQSGFY